MALVVVIMAFCSGRYKIEQQRVLHAIFSFQSLLNQKIVYQGNSNSRHENIQQQTILTAQAISAPVCSTISRYDAHVCSSNIAIKTTMTIDTATTIAATSGKRRN